MTQRTVQLGSFAPGLNNRLEPTRLSTVLPDRKPGTYLYGADNVDLNGEGYLKRRRGQTLALAGNTHSLWADGAGAYAVVNGALCALQPQNTTLVPTTIRSGLPGLPVSYSRGADGDLYWTNGQSIRRISNGVDRPIASELPVALPAVGVIQNGGGLVAGRYLVAFTVVTVDGESPATPVVQFDVAQGSGIQYDASATGTVVDVFMSGPNGDILTWQGRSQGATIQNHNELGRRCPTLNRALMPAGSIVRHYRGRLLVAHGSVLFYSDPYNYGVIDPTSNFVPFPATISVIEPTDNGIYICADKTYWLGDFNETLQELLPYGGIHGTSGRSASDDTVFWQSPRGLVTGDKNQTIKAVQEAALDFADATSGASLYRERDGATHIVSTRFGAGPSVAVATSFMEAEVIRKGTTL